MVTVTLLPDTIIGITIFFIADKLERGACEFEELNLQIVPDQCSI